MTLPATEGFDPRLEPLADWPAPLATRALWEGQLAAVAAIGPALDAIACATEAATARLAANPGGRLVYAGAGSSARIGAQDGAELAPTFDWPEVRLLLMPAGGITALSAAVEDAEDDIDAARAAVHAVGIDPSDVVIAVAASGSTPFTCAVADAARENGALTIGVANSPGGRLLVATEHPILIETGAEPIAGSTRLKAGTTQKVVLNLLSTGIMLGLGRVHRGRMVAMRPRNAKLRARAIQMVATLTGSDAARAETLLEAAGGGIREALLIDAGANPAEAGALLASATSGEPAAPLGLLLAHLRARP